MGWAAGGPALLIDPDTPVPFANGWMDPCMATEENEAPSAEAAMETQEQEEGKEMDKTVGWVHIRYGPLLSYELY